MTTPTKSLEERVAALQSRYETGSFHYVDDKELNLLEALSIITALQSQCASREWRPISEAEESDTWILTCREGGKIPQVAAYDEENGVWHTLNLRWEIENRSTSTTPIWKPTHWMALPSAPMVGGE